jgi:type IV pilus assembly protein PilW
MINWHKQQGMTLIEIMISLLIGIFLIGGILQVFTHTRQTYRMQENLSRMQENGRFAMDFLAKDIRMAGYQGCASIRHITPNVIIDISNPNPNPTPPSLMGGLNSVITGTNTVAANWSASACGVSNDCIANTDALAIHKGGSCGGGLVGNLGVVNANIQINAINTCNISAYDILIISDCSSADIFVATSASAGAGIQTIAHATNQNTSNNLSKPYGDDAEIYISQTLSYFIRVGANGQPALWRLDNNSPAPTGTNPVELIEGIENMQILYGEDTSADGTPNYYVPAGTAGLDMDQVVSIRISLLVRSMDDNLTLVPRAYTYNGATTTPTDRRLRRVFSSTIAVRNRLS